MSQIQESICWMKEAIAEAHLALSRSEVPVGCVFVDRVTQTIVARSGNQVNETKNATRHAEMVGIDEILKGLKDPDSGDKIPKYFTNLICYVTVEPCIMCLAALRELGVREIVFGCRNDRFGGSLLWNAEFGVDQRLTITKSDNAEDEKTAMELLKQFYGGQNPSAPVPKSKKKQQLI